MLCVSSVFILMFQMFHLDVAKVNLGYCICCKLVFQVFQIFQMYISSVSSRYCIYCLWLYTYVSSVCFEYFRCFRLKLQVFHLNVAKVDLNVAYVAMTIYACFKQMFQVFHLFQTYVASVSFGCFKSRSRRSTCCNGMVLLLLGSPYVSKVC
jgi:hypothetical protein